jgi:hypothetical protein
VRYKLCLKNNKTKTRTADVESRPSRGPGSLWIQIAKVFYYHWVDPFDSFLLIIVSSESERDEKILSLQCWALWEGVGSQVWCGSKLLVDYVITSIRKCLAGNEISGCLRGHPITDLSQASRCRNFQFDIICVNRKTSSGSSILLDKMCSILQSKSQHKRFYYLICWAFQ